MPGSGTTVDSCPLCREDSDTAAIADIQDHATKGCDKCALLRGVASKIPNRVDAFDTTNIRRHVWEEIKTWLSPVLIQKFELYVKEGTKIC